MSNHKHKFSFCLWCLCPAHSPHYHPQGPINHAKTAVAAAGLCPCLGWEMFPPCSPAHNGSGCCGNVKISSIFSPESCQTSVKYKVLFTSAYTTSPSIPFPSPTRHFQQSLPPEERKSRISPLLSSIFYFVPYHIPFILYFGDNT